MRVQDYRAASDELRSFMLSQAEGRLGDQHGFAQAADARAATVTSAAAALATAAVGAFAASLAEGVNWPLAAAGFVGAIGFGMAARTAMRSARCLQFHPKGYRPRDFEEDIRLQKGFADIQSEIAEDLDERLDFNARVLVERGELIDGAMRLLWLTPAAIAFAAVTAAALRPVLVAAAA